MNDAKLKDAEIIFLAYNVADLIDESIKSAINNNIISKEQGMALFQIFISNVEKRKKK